MPVTSALKSFGVAMGGWAFVPGAILQTHELIKRMTSGGSKRKKRNPLAGHDEHGTEGQRRAYYLEAMNYLGPGEAFEVLGGAVLVGRATLEQKAQGVDFYAEDQDGNAVAGARREVADYLAALPLPGVEAMRSARNSSKRERIKGLARRWFQRLRVREGNQLELVNVSDNIQRELGSTYHISQILEIVREAWREQARRKSNSVVASTRRNTFLATASGAAVGTVVGRTINYALDKADILEGERNSMQRNAYKFTSQTPVRVHGHERDYPAGSVQAGEVEVDEYYRGKRGRGEHRIAQTPRKNPHYIDAAPVYHSHTHNEDGVVAYFSLPNTGIYIQAKQTPSNRLVLQALDGEGVALEAELSPVVYASIKRDFYTHNFVPDWYEFAQERNPLRRGASHASDNIRELHHGEQYKRTRRKYGEETAHRQAIAAGLRAAGVSRANPRYDVEVYAFPEYIYPIDANNPDEAISQVQESLREEGLPFENYVYTVTDSGLEANPRYRVSVSVPAINESVEESTYTQGGALRKGKRKLKPKLRTQPKFSVERLNPQANPSVEQLKHEAKLYKEEAERLAMYARRTRSPQERKRYAEDSRYYKKLAQQRRIEARNEARAARNPKQARTPSAINKLSRTFHGAENPHTGRTRMMNASNSVRANHVSRLGGLPYIKLHNYTDNNGRSLSTRSGHNAYDHSCARCSLRFNPGTTMLGASGGKKLVILGNGAHKVGRNLRRVYERRNPELMGREIDLGPIEVTGYLTEEKHSPSGEMILYYHPAAEETRLEEDMPHAYIDTEGMLYIPTTGEHSGAYDIDERGIIN